MLVCIHYTQSSFSSRFGHFFDLTSSMDPSRLEAIDRTCFNAGDMATPKWVSEWVRERERERREEERAILLIYPPCMSCSYQTACIYKQFSSVGVVMAEWLRRWTRNPLGSARAGSNPADYNHPFFFSPLLLHFIWHKPTLLLVYIIKFVCFPW